MARDAAVSSWRTARRSAARADIIDAAWSVAREVGVAGLSMRDLARRAGVTTPTLYAYFDSKNDIYDAMFAEAAAQFSAHMAAIFRATPSDDALVAAMRGFAAFCTADVARYQLLFQRTIPSFAPSAESYAYAVAALDDARRWLTSLGVVRDDATLDLLTALTTGLVDQQVSNDPGGQRWVGLIDDAVAMFLTYCRTGQRAADRGRASASNRAATSNRVQSPERRVATRTSGRKRDG